MVTAAPYGWVRRRRRRHGDLRLRAASRRPERPRTQHVTVVPSRGARVVVEERIPEPVAPEPVARPDPVTLP